MKVLYHFMPLPPPMPECVAELQEIALLQKHFDGETIYPNPNAVSPIYLPRLLFGFHQVRQLRRLEKEIDLHHVYNPDPYPYPLLRFLNRPVVYTISGGVDGMPLDSSYFNRLGAVHVADESSLDNLTHLGVKNGVAIRPGLDLANHSVAPSPSVCDPPFRLLLASAPWTVNQFRTKGIDALLQAASLDSTLEIVFLWRGVLEDEMRAKIKSLGLEQQITLINEQVDVNQMLRTVHAAVALAETVGIMKAYPHSLLDSLAAGRPVLTNVNVPMSRYIRANELGVVINQLTAQDILQGVEQLKQHYADFQEHARPAIARDFDPQPMIEQFHSLYTSVL